LIRGRRLETQAAVIGTQVQTQPHEKRDAIANSTENHNADVFFNDPPPVMRDD